MARPLNPNINVREATAEDLGEILEVCGSALGWSDPEFDRRLFTWKHLDNAFGKSLLLVAEDETGILAVRPFLRWRFRRGEEVVAAARAVDTATRPDAQGQGLFRTLTEWGLERLRDEGTGFVFNTPNNKSMPGYLKLGWVDAGPLHLGIGVAGPRHRPGAFARIARSRGAADKRSLPMGDVGEPIDVGLSLLRTPVQPSTLLRTDHDVASLQWRFRDGPLDYRWLPGPRRSGVVVRLRQRLEARELVVAAALGDGEPRSQRRAIRSAMKRLDADYCIGAPGTPGTVPVRRLGPTLALRSVTNSPSAADLGLDLGDIEVF